MDGLLSCLSSSIVVDDCPWQTFFRSSTYRAEVLSSVQGVESNKHIVSPKPNKERTPLARKHIGSSGRARTLPYQVWDRSRL
jgi:hypothetical protein